MFLGIRKFALSSIWKYNFDNDSLFDYEGNPAPPRVQKKLKEDWVKKAIKKGKKLLGEDSVKNKFFT